jgi:hypothetical protein
MAELGPAVTQSLIRNIGGNASRSELDKLSDPIKKMAAQQVMAMSWIETALFHPSFPSQNISSQDKRVFARKLIRLVATYRSKLFYLTPCFVPRCAAT